MKRYLFRCVVFSWLLGSMVSTGLAYDQGIDGSYDYKPKLGHLISREINGIKFHSYITPLAEGGGASTVIESVNGLIVFDTVRNAAHNKELMEFITSLNKPVVRIYVTHPDDHHWLALEMFRQIPVHASETTARTIKEQGEDLLNKARTQSGAEVIPYTRVVVPSQIIRPGEERVEGVLIRYIEPDPKVYKVYGPVTFMEFPEQNVILHQHLGYVGIHAPMLPFAPRRAMLKEMEKKGYSWMMAGHGESEPGSTFIPKVLGYYDTVEQIVSSSPDAKTAKEKLIKAYPGYGAVFLLDLMLPAFYAK